MKKIIKIKSNLKNNKVKKIYEIKILLLY